jgi:hypothetical protein
MCARVAITFGVVCWRDQGSGVPSPRSATTFWTNQPWPNPGCHMVPYDWAMCHLWISLYNLVIAQSHYQVICPVRYKVNAYATCHHVILPRHCHICHVSYYQWCHILCIQPHFMTRSFHLSPCQHPYNHVSLPYRSNSSLKTPKMTAMWHTLVRPHAPTDVIMMSPATSC